MKALARKNRPDIPIETDGLLLFSCERQPNAKKKGKEKKILRLLPIIEIVVFSKYEQVKTEASFHLKVASNIFSALDVRAAVARTERLKVPSGWKRFGKG